jgi:hypothetical protein
MTNEITTEAGMTGAEMRREFAELSEALPALVRAAEQTAQKLEAAQERLDGIDADQWHGKPSGALAGALSAVQTAEIEAARAKLALGANHRRRLELVQRLRALVTA